MDELLKQLAEKLGTTTEHLWGVLIKQAPISATCDMLIIAAIALVTVGLIIATYLLNKRDADAAVFFVALSIGGCAMLCLAVMTLTSSIVAGFINPEFWALQQIGHLIK